MSTTTVRLTMAQALVRFLTAQKVDIDGHIHPLFGGVWAIFGHGNVAGLGEALYPVRDAFPTYRAHNEQAMAHAAIAFAKTHNRRRMMACTTSIGPGATNMVTAAALAHVNRLPVLLLPGDTFANRVPDPVLQQVEAFTDPTVSANDCFRPVSRYFDRIVRPEQLISSLPAAMEVLTDPQLCGPVTLALPQDVQAEAYDYPQWLFEERVHRMRRFTAEEGELQQAVQLLRKAKKPLLIAGGGVHYSDAGTALDRFCTAHGIPVCETQAGKGALAWDHPCQAGAVGVTGSAAANRLASEADLVLAVGTRFQDFTTGSRTLFSNPQVPLVSLNVNPFDAVKHRALPLRCDARAGLQQLSAALDDWKSSHEWRDKIAAEVADWNQAVEQVTAASDAEYPSDAQVLGAVNRFADADDVVVCAAGGLPGELHKLWRTSHPRGYHVEYGYSCMGYEIAGGMGVKMALPEHEVFVLVGDGSYLMLNSEIATSVMLGYKLIIVALDNRGFGCINRLQHGTGGAGFNNLLQDCRTTPDGAPLVDFAAHARALGAESEQVVGIGGLQEALNRAKAADKTYVISLRTDPLISTEAGGNWWDVAVPEVSQRSEVNAAYTAYRDAKKRQPY